MTTPYFDSQASARSILGDERLAPDLLLPAQWNARSRPIMEPEAKLIWAIFESAWLELLRPRDRHGAEVWFAHPCYQRDGGFSLSDVCDYLGWDADLVREAARARVLAARDPAMPADPISTETVCELLSVPPQRVHDMARRGRLRAVKDGGKRCWYSRREVERLAASRMAVLPPQSRSEPSKPENQPEIPSAPRLRVCGHPMTRANSYVNTGGGKGSGCLICHRRRDREYRKKRSRRERIARLEEENREVRQCLG